MGDVTADRPTLPDGLLWMLGSPRTHGWLTAIPELVDRAVRRWGLQLGAPFASSHVSWTAPARCADGADVVLKIQFPHPECEHEAEALRRWRGDGAVRLLEHQADDHALLLERCTPGAPLAEEPADVALDIVVGLLRRMMVPAGAPFQALADEAELWAQHAPGHWEEAGRPFERRLLDAAVELLHDLPTDRPGAPVLVHQDLHGGNVLSAGREPWLVIDPKPLAAEPAFAGAPVIRSNELGHSAAHVRRRVDAVTDELGVDRRRVVAWAFAQTVAWSFHEGGVIDRHLDTARWLAADL